MLKIKVAAVAISIVALLTGCSNGSSLTLQAFEGVKQTCDHYVGGAEIDSVKVTANANQAPTVDFVTTDDKAGVESALAKIKKTQTKVIKEGSGPTFTGDEMVILEYAAYSSTTGALIGASKFDGTDVAAQVFDSTTTKIYCDALSGVKEGSLVAFATPAVTDDPEGTLYVFELRKVYLPRANGAEQSPVSGFPQVVRNPATGEPGLISPTFSKPTEYKSAVLIQGKGEAIAEGDSVTVHYSLWHWADRLGDTLESSWDSNQPATLNIQSGTGGTIGCWVKALPGIKVGSQVIMVCPPTDAYGVTGNGTVPGNATLLFVVDVLGINK